MQGFIAKHPLWTQFVVLVTVVLAGIPSWGLVWWAIAEVGRILITEGCQARNYSCEYEGQGMTILFLVLIPFFFIAFVMVVSKISGLITERLVRWAGLDPKQALR